MAGLQRRLTLRNLTVPVKVLASLVKARRVIRRFGADVAVGFGGYASAPVLWSAQRMGIPTLIQEQNSYAGVTNKLLASRARRICVAYEGMERFFPADRIVLTGQSAARPFRRFRGRRRAESRGAGPFRAGGRQTGRAGRRGKPRHPDVERGDEGPCG